MKETAKEALKAEMVYEVPFHDVDSMNVCWHGHYVRYFELVRCKLLEKIGYTYDVMEADGHFWPVVDVRIKYVRPLLFRQKIRLIAELVEWEYRLVLKYQIRDVETDECLTKAKITQIAVDAKSGQMCFESPPPLIERLEMAGYLR